MPTAPVRLDAIRACLEGAIPGVMATCSADGTPNATYISQVEYLDADHVALSFQFFSKTRHNVLANPVVELLVVHPLHGATYRLSARYLRTEAQGPVFERMKAKLAGIASHEGMAGVFRLRGADIYAVDRVEQVAAPRHAAAHAGASRLSALTLSFMGESRRLDNRRLKRELRVRLRYPTIADGLRAASAG